MEIAKERERERRTRTHSQRDEGEERAGPFVADSFIEIGNPPRSRTRLRKWEGCQRDYDETHIGIEAPARLRMNVLAAIALAPYAV
jgi:hypothetical protein